MSYNYNSNCGTFSSGSGGRRNAGPGGNGANAVAYYPCSGVNPVQVDMNPMGDFQRPPTRSSSGEFGYLRPTTSSRLRQSPNCAPQSQGPIPSNQQQMQIMQMKQMLQQRQQQQQQQQYNYPSGGGGYGSGSGPAPNAFRGPINPYTATGQDPIQVRITADQLQNASYTPTIPERGEAGVEGMQGVKYVPLKWEDILGQAGLNGMKVSMLPNADSGDCNANRQLKVSFGGAGRMDAGEQPLKVVSFQPLSTGRVDCRAPAQQVMQGSRGQRQLPSSNNCGSCPGCRYN